MCRAQSRRAAPGARGNRAGRRTSAFSRAWSFDRSRACRGRRLRRELWCDRHETWARRRLRSWDARRARGKRRLFGSSGPWWSAVSRGETHPCACDQERKQYASKSEDGRAPALLVSRSGRDGDRGRSASHRNRLQGAEYDRDLGTDARSQRLRGCHERRQRLGRLARRGETRVWIVVDAAKQPSIEARGQYDP